MVGHARYGGDREFKHLYIVDTRGIFFRHVYNKIKFLSGLWKE